MAVVCSVKLFKGVVKAVFVRGTLVTLAYTAPHALALAQDPM